ncbi:hypothetical protein GLE_0094 [Lysobacter enzymogenes]|uniref:Uncharacterized protein n=1 Tax=Lysobacter enzymogenes TaxID=69 RepID=A0A0S2DAN4_LYSEN|nr:hypothetical protein GLE_0094 [Lysobacter enzymogenes]
MRMQARGVPRRAGEGAAESVWHAMPEGQKRRRRLSAPSIRTASGPGRSAWDRTMGST